MNFESPYFIVVGLASVIVLLTGFISLKRPPKKINSFYGYRTARAMKSPMHWEFAQKYSSLQFLRIGYILLFIAILGLFFLPRHTYDGYVVTAIVIIACLTPIILTERQLIKLFKDERNNKHS